MGRARVLTATPVTVLPQKELLLAQVKDKQKNEELAQNQKQQSSGNMSLLLNDCEKPTFTCHCYNKFEPKLLHGYISKV